MFFAKEYAVKLSRNKHFARLLLNIQDSYEELVVALVEDRMELRLIEGDDASHFQ